MQKHTVKVKVPCNRPRGPEGGKDILYSFLTSAIEGWVVSTITWPLYPEKDTIPTVQEAGWAPGPVWACARNLAPPGFDPWTVQPVASRKPYCTNIYLYHNVQFLDD
jgi:hypothetical protein